MLIHVLEDEQEQECQRMQIRLSKEEDINGHSQVCKHAKQSKEAQGGPREE